MSCEMQATDILHKFIIFTAVNSHVKETLRKITSSDAKDIVFTESKRWQTTLIQVGIQNETFDEKKLIQSFNSEDQSCSKDGIQATITGSSNFVEALIYAKNVVDASESSTVDVHALSSQQKIAFLCDQLFNSQSYEVKVHKVEYGGEDEDSNEEQLTKELLNNLAALPSSDGKPVKPLHSILFDLPDIYHGFTTRQGGISTFPSMKSLNMVFSSVKKDTPLFVKENRRRLAEKIGFDPNRFEMAKSVHGNDVWITGEPKPASYDGIVTNEIGLTIAAPGADCPTLLFYDPVKKVVGAAHSGWKGTLANISKNVLEIMKTKFHSNASDIRVAIGPSLSECCFEVDFPLAETFANQFSKSIVVRPQGAPRPFVNLWQCITMSLTQEGVLLENIDNGRNSNVHETQRVTQCTKCDSNKEKFFSYRRDGKLFGNQCAFIGIKDI